ncbi:MAG: hypothetical protein M3P14_11015, partial [Chloroflexota bacterium]|nr:hypothetical protein [Chloroflexota bacterium]
DASIAEWVISDGYEWGMSELAPWMTDLVSTAGVLGSPALVAYLEGRERALRASWEDLRLGMGSLQRLARSLRSASAASAELRDPSRK